MADATLVTIVAYLHIFSAISWFGGAILFLSVISPGLKTASPQANLEFLTKVGKRATRFFGIVSTLTIIFGVTLLLVSGVNDTPVYVGAILGLAAWLDAVLFTIPALNKADNLAEKALANPQAGPPPPELMANVKKGGMGVLIVVVLLTLTLAFMVISGFMF